MMQSYPLLARFSKNFLAVTLLLVCSRITASLTQPKVNRSPAHMSFVGNLHFQEIGAKAGVRFTHQHYAVDPKIKNLSEWMTARGAAVAVADFNGDGNMDFYVTSSGEGSPNGLFLNRGDGTFEDVAAKMGVADVNHGFNSMAALWIDYDNDGFPDLYVVGMGCNKLFHNVKGQHFEDVTLKAGQVRGIPDQYGMCGSPSSVMAFDYNRDGLLDIFVSNTFVKDRRKIRGDDTWLVNPLPSKLAGGPKSYLLRNNGDGTFTEVADQLGVANNAWATSAGAGDVNGDGWPDLFVANDASPDRLFLNHEGKYFEETTKESFPGQYGRVGMSAEMVDLDGDGLPEIYSTKITSAGYMAGRNELWQNVDGRHFRNVALDNGVAACGWSWNAKFFDIGHRGEQDLAVVNGLYSGSQKSYWFPFNSVRAMDNYFVTDAKFWPPMKGRDLSGHEHSCMFVKTADGYVDVSKVLGVDDDLDGRGLATIDIRNDGRLSMLVGNANGPALLYENTSDVSGNDWIGFDLRVTRGKRNAVGARVHVEQTVDGRKKSQYLEVNAGNGYASQSDPRLVFGLGEKPAKVDRITVRWPSGSEQVLKDFKVGAYNKIYEPN